MPRERFTLPPPLGPLPEQPQPCLECGGDGRRGLTITHDAYGHVIAIGAGPVCAVCGGSGEQPAPRPVWP